MNELVTKNDIKIENYIYEIRGQRVMLDSDIAMFFQYETKQINRQVARNIKRFPENYCFRLTEKSMKTRGAKLAPQVKITNMVVGDIFHMFLLSMV